MLCTSVPQTAMKYRNTSMSICMICETTAPTRKLLHSPCLLQIYPNSCSILALSLSRPTLEKLHHCFCIVCWYLGLWLSGFSLRVLVFCVSLFSTSRIFKKNHTRSLATCPHLQVHVMAAKAPCTFLAFWKRRMKVKTAFKPPTVNNMLTYVIIC